MAKCVVCGKSGLFLRVNMAGLCADCEAEYRRKTAQEEAEKAARREQREVKKNAREIMDPHITRLQKDIEGLQKQLDAANRKLRAFELAVKGHDLTKQRELAKKDAKPWLPFDSLQPEPIPGLPIIAVEDRKKVLDLIAGLDQALIDLRPEGQDKKFHDAFRKVSLFDEPINFDYDPACGGVPHYTTLQDMPLTAAGRVPKYVQRIIFCSKSVINPLAPQVHGVIDLLKDKGGIGKAEAFVLAGRKRIAGSRDTTGFKIEFTGDGRFAEVKRIVTASEWGLRDDIYGR